MPERGQDRGRAFSFGPLDHVLLRLTEQRQPISGAVWCRIRESGWRLDIRPGLVAAVFRCCHGAPPKGLRHIAGAGFNAVDQ
jgi:hypothetical protein